MKKMMTIHVSFTFALYQVLLTFETYISILPSYIVLHPCIKLALILLHLENTAARHLASRNTVCETTHKNVCVLMFVELIETCYTLHPHSFPVTLDAELL